MHKYIDVEKQRNIESTITILGLGTVAIVTFFCLAIQREGIDKMNSIEEFYIREFSRSKDMNEDNILDSVAFDRGNYHIFIGQPDGTYKRLDYYLFKGGILDSTYQSIEEKIM